MAVSGTGVAGRPSGQGAAIRNVNSSIRQRIQTLGRILRTGDDPDEQSTLYVLYARDTVDERIFQEYDWQTELASAHVDHYVWEPDPDEGFANGQIREATPDEYPPRPEPPTIPDPDELELGDPYEGSRDPVRQVSVDSQGRLFEKQRDGRQYLSTDGFGDAIDFVMRKKGGGTLIVNEHDHLLTVLQDGPVFLGTVEGPDAFEASEESGPTSLTDESGSLTDDPEELDDIF